MAGVPGRLLDHMYDDPPDVVAGAELFPFCEIVQGHGPEDLSGPRALGSIEIEDRIRRVLGRDPEVGVGVVDVERIDDRLAGDRLLEPPPST